MANNSALINPHSGKPFPLELIYSILSHISHENIILQVWPASHNHWPSCCPPPNARQCARLASDTRHLPSRRIALVGPGPDWNRTWLDDDLHECENIRSADYSRWQTRSLGPQDPTLPIQDMMTDLHRLRKLMSVSTDWLAVIRQHLAWIQITVQVVVPRAPPDINILNEPEKSILLNASTLVFRYPPIGDLEAMSRFLSRLSKLKYVVLPSCSIEINIQRNIWDGRRLAEGVCEGDWRAHYIILMGVQGFVTRLRCDMVVSGYNELGSIKEIEIRNRLEPYDETGKREGSLVVLVGCRIRNRTHKPFLMSARWVEGWNMAATAADWKRVKDEKVRYDRLIDEHPEYSRADLAAQMTADVSLERVPSTVPPLGVPTTLWHTWIWNRINQVLITPSFKWSIVAARTDIHGYVSQL